MARLPRLSARIAAVIVAAASAFLAAGSSSGAVGGCDVEVLGGAEPALAARVVSLVNAHRRARGLRPVIIGPALVRSATWKAGHLARNRYLAHADLPGGRSAQQRFRACGFRRSGWGEVLGAGHRRPDDALRSWLGSPAHRRILEATWWRVGGAAVGRSRDGELYWVLDFGA